MPYGYTGRIIRVDLTKGEISTEEPDEFFYRRYFGGGAMASYYLLKEMEPGVDPLGPGNVIVFATSAIVGCPVVGVSRFTIAARSPLTGAYGEADAGGFWGPELKFAGYDAIIVKGLSPEPVFLWIHDGEAELRSAASYWGQMTKEVEYGIRAELGDPLIRVVQTGVAGENLVRYASVVNNLKHFNGRTGMGAVMGAKKLKAIAVRGHQKLQYKDPERVKHISRMASRFHNVFSELGTAGNVQALNAAGILPTRNFRSGEFEEAANISGETMRDTILVKREGCYACSIRCKRVVKADGRYQVDPSYGGPEYETVASMGSLLGIGDIEAVAKGNELCNRYVLDTISTGTTIAFAMECFENGLLTPQDTGGLDLRFGNADAALCMIEMIGRREGLGNLLAEGVMRAAQKLGNGAERYAMHVKGQELPMHEPRGKTGLGLAYALSNTGAHHSEMPHDPLFQAEGKTLERARAAGILEPVESLELGARKARLFYYGQQIWKVNNSIGACLFATYPLHNLDASDLVDLVRAVTGWNVSLLELHKLAERANALGRAFNVREGFTAKDDMLPERLFQPLEGGTLAGRGLDKEEFSKTLKLYYQMAGWDPGTGIPTQAKLDELDISWVEEVMLHGGAV